MSPREVLMYCNGQWMNHSEWTALLQRADAAMKATNGHSYLTILKTRCQHCGRSPRQKGKCPAWLNTFCDELYRLLQQPSGEAQERASDA